MSSPVSHGSHLKRTLGLPAVLLFGLAYMAPLIVYGTYGVLAKASDDTASLAYLLALFAITFTALSYGRLARIYPVAGSAYTYTRRNFNAHIGFMIGWATLLDYFFIPMVIWLIGAAYLNTAFPLIPLWIWIVAFIVLTSAVNIVGIELAARFNIALMAVQLIVVALFVILCWHYALAAAGPGGLALAAPLFKPHVPLAATMSGAAIAAYSYLGFDAVSTLTEETIRSGTCRARSCGSLSSAAPFSCWPPTQCSSRIQARSSTTPIQRPLKWPRRSVAMCSSQCFWPA
jgi:putrescine importer